MLSLLIFFFGSTIGSFLLIFVERFFTEESFIYGRSHCDHCQHRLGIFDLVPLLSQLFLRGRCRYCKTKISFLNFFTELICGLIFLSAFLHFTSVTQALSFLFCLVLSLFDAKNHGFPLLVWGGFAVIFFLIFPFHVTMLCWFFLALLAECFPLKIGSGDFLWLFILSYFLSFIQLVEVIQIASVLGLLWYVFKKEKELAFIPFLSIGYLILFLTLQIH